MNCVTDKCLVQQTVGQLVIAFLTWTLRKEVQPKRHYSCHGRGPAMSIVMTVTKHALFVTGAQRLCWSLTTLQRAVSERSSQIYSLQLHYEWWSAEKLTTGEKPNPKHLSGRSRGQGINDKWGGGARGRGYDGLGQGDGAGMTGREEGREGGGEGTVRVDV